MVIIMLLAERKNNCYCEHIVVGVFVLLLYVFMIGTVQVVPIQPDK